MIERIWNSIEIEAGMRALVRTLAPEGPLAERAARLVAAVQAHLRCNYDPAALEPIDEVTLAARLVDPWLRQQLVRALVIGILIDDAATRFDLARVEAIAAALGVDEPAVGDAALYIAKKKWRLRRRVLARFWVVEHVKKRMAERGRLRTIVQAIWGTVFRRYHDAALAARFATLRELPAGSFGRAFIAYLEVNKFPLPGVRGAVTDLIVPHDLAHVLSGYTTAPVEEIQVVTFSAGHRKQDPFALVMFALFQFHLGLRLTPGAKAERGLFDPAQVIAAVVRGAAVTRDLTTIDWEYWPELALPLEEVRRRYNVEPRTVVIAPRRLHVVAADRSHLTATATPIA